MKRSRDIQEELLQAIQFGEHRKVKTLIQEGVDVNEPNFYGKTPLLLSAERGHKECVSLLLSANADPKIADFEGLTPLCVAFWKDIIIV